MMVRCIGAVLILASCGAAGFRGAMEYGKEIRDRKFLLQVLDRMSWELSYRLTPLPQLCKLSASQAGGSIRWVFHELARELEQEPYHDVIGAMSVVLQRKNRVSNGLYPLLENLGGCLGRFDLSGQLAGIASVRERTLKELSALENNRDLRTRSIQTLGFCAGAALVILFI